MRVREFGGRIQLIQSREELLLVDSDILDAIVFYSEGFAGSEVGMKGPLDGKALPVNFQTLWASSGMSLIHLSISGTWNLRGGAWKSLLDKAIGCIRVG